MLKQQTFLCKFLIPFLVLSISNSNANQNKSTQATPKINLVERSDWLNVRTDITPPAIGNGIHDDTASIQTALNKLGANPGDSKVIYFPPGTYKITKTLDVLSSKKNKSHGISGIMLIGHGNDSKIEWHGEKGGNMFWSNGIHRSKFEGLVWDGRNIADVGIFHNAKYRFETRIIHRNMLFQHFRKSGIRVHHNQKKGELASAEIYYENLIFKNNLNGVLINQFNNYNNYFNSCNFINNTTGINVPIGNAVVHNSTFINSSNTDMLFGAHSFSIRRVTSKNSFMFVKTKNVGSNAVSIVIEDSTIDSWKNNNGAINTSGRGPITIFDTSFLNPPNEQPPVKFTNGLIAPHQIGILSNISFKNKDNIISKGISSNKIYLIPNTENKNKLTSIKKDKEIDFSNTQPILIYDIKSDCGAKGNGKTDDTKAIQNCIDRASNTNKGSFTEVYFPSGNYILTDTLNISGSNYRISGTGWHSKLNWDKPINKLPIIVSDTHNVSISSIGISSANLSKTSISHYDKLNNASNTNYENLYIQNNNHDSKLVLTKLANNSLVTLKFINGNIELLNTVSSTIVGKFLLSQLSISGSYGAETGFLGVSGLVSLLGKHQLNIENNRSIIVSDWYSEQSDYMYRFSGDNKSPPGKVILHHTKAYFHKPENSGHLASINYSGTIAHNGGLFGAVNLKTNEWFTHHQRNTGDQKLNLIYAGNQFMVNQPKFEIGSSTKLVLIGNNVEGLSLFSDSDVKDKNESELLIIREIFDNYQLLGKYDSYYFK